jgi:hypothetical protein
MGCLAAHCAVSSKRTSRYGPNYDHFT